MAGAFSVAGQETRSPLSLWRRFASVSGISESKFFAYYETSANGTGIRVGEVLAPAQPMCLSGDLGVARPLQSFQYVATDTAKTVLDSMTQLRAASAA